MGTMSDRARTMRPMADLTQRIPAWNATEGQWQAILNAAPIPARRAQRDLPSPVPIDARVIWERDGLEVIRTLAHGWAGHLAYVELRDPRAHIRWVWLPAEDVTRVPVEVHTADHG